jgi:hypothetical protein
VVVVVRAGVERAWETKGKKEREECVARDGWAVRDERETDRGD